MPGRVPADPRCEAWPLTLASFLDHQLGPDHSSQCHVLSPERPLLSLLPPAAVPVGTVGVCTRSPGLDAAGQPRLPGPPLQPFTWESTKRPQGQPQSLGAACHNHNIHIGPSWGLGLTLPQRALGSPEEQEQVTWSPLLLALSEPPVSLSGAPCPAPGARPAGASQEKSRKTVTVPRPQREPQPD